MTESIDEFNLCQEAFFKANSNDINPIIYVRIAKGYAPKPQKLPKFEIGKYYETQPHFGLRFSLSPDFQYTYNQQIINQTSEQFQQLGDDMKKFDPKTDEDLYKSLPLTVAPGWEVESAYTVPDTDGRTNEIVVVMKPVR